MSVFNTLLVKCNACEAEQVTYAGRHKRPVLRHGWVGFYPPCAEHKSMICGCQKLEQHFCSDCEAPKGAYVMLE